MRKSYLGIACPSGLILLIPENRHAERFLVRRACRLDAVCFWAVIDESFYSTIHCELERGEAMNGLKLVQLLAQDVGTVLPSTHAREPLIDFA